jgi:hypothetical protein
MAKSWMQLIAVPAVLLSLDAHAQEPTPPPPPPPPASPPPDGGDAMRRADHAGAAAEAVRRTDEAAKRMEESAKRIEAASRREPPFRLMESGVTLGGAVALTMGGTFATADVEQNTGKAVFMPYILFAPAYWFDRSHARYCASHWTGSEDALTDSPKSGCWAHKLGLWVGRPFDYDATTTVYAPGEPRQQAQRTVEPLLAVGLGLSPNAFTTFGIGLGVNNIPRTDGTQLIHPPLLLSFGVNLDFVKALFTVGR